MDKTVSSTFGVEVSAEAGVTIELIFTAKVSTKTSFALTSSETWRTETTITDTIKVNAGQSVVVWQYVYDGRYDNTNIPFRSNIFQHTQSLSVAPTEQFE
jgi:hypothetical protein